GTREGSSNTSGNGEIRDGGEGGLGKDSSDGADDREGRLSEDGTDGAGNWKGAEAGSCKGSGRSSGDRYVGNGRDSSLENNNGWDGGLKDNSSNALSGSGGREGDGLSAGEAAHDATGDGDVGNGTNGRLQQHGANASGGRESGHRGASEGSNDTSNDRSVRDNNGAGNGCLKDHGSQASSNSRQGGCLSAGEAAGDSAGDSEVSSGQGGLKQDGSETTDG
ncbi:uncharacterized protein BDZ83DRAFT_531518, partial [Colletotrichum acutatum]